MMPIHDRSPKHTGRKDKKSIISLDKGTCVGHEGNEWADTLAKKQPQ